MNEMLKCLNCGNESLPEEAFGWNSFANGSLCAACSDKLIPNLWEEIRETLARQEADHD